MTRWEHGDGQREVRREPDGGHHVCGVGRTDGDRGCDVGRAAVAAQFVVQFVVQFGAAGQQHRAVGDVHERGEVLG